MGVKGNVVIPALADRLETNPGKGERGATVHGSSAACPQLVFLEPSEYGGGGPSGGALALAWSKDGGGAGTYMEPGLAGL